MVGRQRHFFEGKFALWQLVINNQQLQCTAIVGPSSSVRQLPSFGKGHRQMVVPVPGPAISP